METLFLIRETWLTKKPRESAFVIAGLMTLLLALGTLLYWKNFGGALSWMPATQNSVFGEHNFWRAWTALFAHADEKHLLSNSFLFFILSSFLGSYFGWVMFPLMAFVLGGITNLIVLQGMPPQTQLLGASGIVFWLGGAWIALYFLLDVKRTPIQRFLRALGVSLLLFFPAEAFDPHISYQSHFVGFLLGILTGIIWYFAHRRTFLNAVVREIVVEDDFQALNDREYQH